MKLKAQVPTKYPTDLRGHIGIDVTKVNGNWHVEFDPADLPLMPAAPLTPTQYYLVFDPATGLYSLGQNVFSPLPAPGGHSGSVYPYLLF